MSRVISLIASAFLVGAWIQPSFAADAAPPSTAPPRSVANRERTVGEVEDGIYLIKHKDAPDTNPQGNTVVIIGDRDVLVIDSAYLPSSAKEDIAQIRAWTQKPVHFLLNTHWHPDHIRGNQAYAEAFAGLTILGHASTPELEEGYDVPNRARYQGRIAVLEDQLKRAKGDAGKKLSEPERRAINDQLAGRRAVWQEFAAYSPVYPNVTFNDAMTVDLGNRVVQLRFFGRGHSSGDIVAYLPRERILVTGDLVTSPVPYFFAGYPYEEITVLEKLAAMDANVIIPGHGDVMMDKTFLNRTIEVMKDIRDQVVREVRQRGPLSAKYEDVRKAVNTKSYATEFAGSDKKSQEFFQESMDGLVRLYFEQAPK